MPFSLPLFFSSPTSQNEQHLSHLAQSRHSLERWFIPLLRRYEQVFWVADEHQQSRNAATPIIVASLVERALYLHQKQGYLCGCLRCLDQAATHLRLTKRCRNLFLTFFFLVTYIYKNQAFSPST